MATVNGLTVSYWRIHTINIFFHVVPIKSSLHTVNSMENCSLLSLGHDLGLISYRKVFVSQILNEITAVDFNSYAMLFHFHAKPILKVEVVGILRGIESKRGKIIYACDDGTGVIYGINFPDDCAGIFLSFSIGNLVSIKGSIAKVETNNIPYGFVIRISHISKLTEPNLELLHWIQVMHQNCSRKVPRPTVTNQVLLEWIKNVDDLTARSYSSLSICNCSEDDLVSRYLRYRLMFCKCNVSCRYSSRCLIDLKTVFLCLLLSLEDDLEDEAVMLAFTVDDIM